VFFIGKNIPVTRDYFGSHPKDGTILIKTNGNKSIIMSKSERKKVDEKLDLGLMSLKTTTKKEPVNFDKRKLFRIHKEVRKKDPDEEEKESRGFANNTKFPVNLSGWSKNRNNFMKNAGINSEMDDANQGFFESSIKSRRSKTRMNESKKKYMETRTDVLKKTILRALRKEYEHYFIQFLKCEGYFLEFNNEQFRSYLNEYAEYLKSFVDQDQILVEYGNLQDLPFTIGLLIDF
jgi:hypothetical protein